MVYCLYLCRAGNGWWWVPLVAPPIGGVLGAGLYKAVVELHHPHPSEAGGEMVEEAVPLDKEINTIENMCV